MAILEMQGMQPSARRGGGHGGDGGGSNFSVLLCDSMISVLLCL
jgi:hypothetical protein